MKQTETLVIRRRGGDRIVAIHKIGGVTVGRAEVKRHPDDADDFLTGAEFVVKKLTAHLDPIKTVERKHPPCIPNPADESDPRNLKAGDRVLVRDDLVPTTLYGAADATNDMVTLGGKVLTLSNKSLFHDMWEAKENGRWWSPEMFVGKIVPCGELKAGDEVLVKSIEDGDLDSIQAAYADKLVQIQSICDGCGNPQIGGDGCCVAKHRFVGKLIRFNR